MWERCVPYSTVFLKCLQPAIPTPHPNCALWVENPGPFLEWEVCVRRGPVEIGRDQVPHGFKGSREKRKWQSWVDTSWKKSCYRKKNRAMGGSWRGIWGSGRIFVVYFRYDETANANDPKKKMWLCSNQATDCRSYVGIRWEVEVGAGETAVHPGYGG